MSLFDNIPSSFPSIINMTETKLNNQTFNESNLDVWMNDLPGTGMRNTQQLNVDWEDFSNHCFFNSAEAKVNLAFDTIINQYPFDGTTEERLHFKNDIDGYTAWILNKITKNLGFLTFSGNEHIEIKDLTGYLTPQLARDPGKTLLTKNIDSKGCTLEFWFKIENFDPNDADNQIIFQKYENDAGITCYKTHSYVNGEWKHYINLIISSDEFKSISTIVEVTENNWHHIAFVFNQTTSNNILSYLDGNLVKQSEQRTFIDSIVLGNKNLTIGSGSIHNCRAISMTSANQLINFSLDELRFWTIARSAENILKYKNINIPAQDNLKLYFKFNEPKYGDENVYPSHVVLDSSGNAFHSLIDGYNPNMRTGINKFDEASPWHIVLEDLEVNPVLFPNYPDTLSLNEELLLLGNHYDRNNPNLITKLVPPHYFTEAQYFEGIAKNLEDPEGIEFKDVTTPFPGQSELPPRVLLMSFLMVWAQFYDEIKLWIDSFSSLNKVDYKGFDQIPDHILMFMAKYYGIQLPNAYKNENISKYNFGINLDNQNSLSSSLENINNQIWKRLLINLPSLWRSRGTINGLKALFNTLAIELDTVFEFKEFGGNLDNVLRNSLEKVYKLQGFVKNSRITSPILEGVRHYNDGSAPASLGFFDEDFTIEVGLRMTNTENHNCFKIASTGIEFISVDIEILDDYFVPTLTLNDSINVENVEMDPISEPLNNWLISISRSYKEDNSQTALYDYTISFGLVGTNIVYTKTIEGTTIAPIQAFSFESEANDIATIKIWTKKLTAKESLLHQQNLTSIYTESSKKWIELYDSADQSLVNSTETLYDTTLDDNSWERLMVNIQNFDVLDSSTNSYTLTDITGNKKHFTVHSDISSFYKKKIKQLVASSNFLYNVSTNKVRVRSTSNSETADSKLIHFGELTKLPQSINTDDRRFAIEASIVSALNKDILNVFSDISDFNNYLGAPEQEYAIEYDFMKHFNEAYFQRMNGTINYKTIIEFQRWFNENFQDLVALFLPYTTDFLGINFVIESHLLERAKMQYQQGDVHVDIYDRVAVERVQAMQGIAKTH